MGKSSYEKTSRWRTFLVGAHIRESMGTTCFQVNPAAQGWNSILFPQRLLVCFNSSPGPGSGFLASYPPTFCFVIIVMTPYNSNWNWYVPAKNCFILHVWSSGLRIRIKKHIPPCSLDRAAQTKIVGIFIVLHLKEWFSASEKLITRVNFWIIFYF